MTQKYESLSFCELLDEIDDTDRLLLSLSVLLRVVSFLLKYLISLEPRSVTAFALGIGMLDEVCSATLLRRVSAPVIPLTKFFIFSILL